MARQDDILSISDVASLLKVGEKSPQSPTQKGDLPAFDVGCQRRFRRTFIDTWIDVKTRTGGGLLLGSGPKLSYAGGGN